LFWNKPYIEGLSLHVFDSTENTKVQSCQNLSILSKQYLHHQQQSVNRGTQLSFL